MLTKVDASNYNVQWTTPSTLAIAGDVRGTLGNVIHSQRNNSPYYIQTADAVEHMFFNVGPGNGVNWYNAGGVSTSWYNQAGSTLLMSLANAGGLTISTGGLSVTGNVSVSSGSIGATGDISGRYLYTTDSAIGLISSQNGPLVVRGASGLVQMDGAGGLLLTTKLLVGSSSVANSLNAPIAIAAALGNRLCIYDAGSGSGYGIGMNSGEISLFSQGQLVNFRMNSYAGASMMAFGPNVTWMPTGAGALVYYINFGGNDSLTNAQNSYINWRRSYDNVSPMSIYGSGLLQTLGAVQSATSHNAYSAPVDGYGFRTNNTANVNGQGYANAWVTASSKEFKKNVKPMRDPIAGVLNPALRGIEYDHTWRAQGAKADTTTHHIGFVADDFQPFYPEIVSTDKDGKPMGMDYARVTAILWEALRSYMLDTNARLDRLEPRA